jgi:hypothetical protein
VVDQATGELTAVERRANGEASSVMAWGCDRHRRAASVGDRLQVLSKSWLTDRFRSFSVLLPYQQIPLRA